MKAPCANCGEPPEAPDEDGTYCGLYECTVCGIHECGSCATLLRNTRFKWVAMCHECKPMEFEE
jgi:hypothetical protein